MNRSWEGIKSVFNEIIYYPVMIWLKKIWHLKNCWSQSSNYSNNDVNCLTLLPDQSVAVKRLWCTSGSHLFLCILIYNSWLQISWLFSKLSRGCKHAFDLSALPLFYYIQYLDIFQLTIIKIYDVFPLQSEKLALMESMKQELEEKIRKLEEDKQNMDISAGKIFGTMLIILAAYCFSFIII